MIEGENGGGTQTLRPPAVPDHVGALDDGSVAPGRRARSRKARGLIAGGIAVAVLAGGGLVAVVSGSSSKPKHKPKPHIAAPVVLTPVQIAAEGKQSTVEVIAYGDPGSPLVQLGGGSNILDSAARGSTTRTRACS